MADTNFSQIAAFIWSVADLLRGDFKQSQYGRVILPFTLLRRLECVLSESKEAVVAQAEKVKAMNLPEEAQENSFCVRPMIWRSSIPHRWISARWGRTASRITWRTTFSASQRMHARSLSTLSFMSLSAS
jgi:type I restriction-modification system DNA methylase subunit